MSAQEVTTVKEYDEAMRTQAKTTGAPVRRRANPPISLHMWANSKHRRIAALDRSGAPIVREHSGAGAPQRRKLNCEDLRIALLADRDPSSHPRTSDDPVILADWATARACRKLAARARDYDLLRIFDTALALRPSTFIPVLTELLQQTYYHPDARVKSLAGWLRSFGLASTPENIITVIDNLDSLDDAKLKKRREYEASVLVASRFSGSQSANRIYRDLSTITALDEHSAASDPLLHRRAQLNGTANVVKGIVSYDDGEVICSISSPCKLRVGARLILTSITSDTTAKSISQSATVSSIRIADDGSAQITLNVGSVSRNRLISACKTGAVVLTPKPFIAFTPTSSGSSNRWLNPSQPQSKDAKIRRQVPSHIVLAGAAD